MQIKYIATAELRGTDCKGSGHYGASRGSRTHNGIDYKVPVGAEVVSPVNGIVTKVGYPYGDDLTFRYIEITCGLSLKHRVFYVKPLRRVSIGSNVGADESIGTCQDLTNRYPGITPHVHYEVKDQDGNFIDPDSL